MRMCKKRALSFILVFALITGCFAGTGIAVKAEAFGIGISSEKLESGGGEATVTITGDRLGDVIWWVLEKEVSGKKGEEEYEAVGKKVNTSDLEETHEGLEFTVEIPENTEDADVTYRIQVARTDPYDPVSDEYTWEKESAEVVVEAEKEEPLEEQTEESENPESETQETENPEAAISEEQSEENTKAVSSEEQFGENPEDIIADMEEAVDVKEEDDSAEIPDVSEAGTEEILEKKEAESYKSSVPKYHNIPPYQEKNVSGGTTVKIKSLPVEEILDGKPGGAVAPYTKAIKFQIFDSTEQKVKGIVEAKNGKLPELSLTDNHTYIITSKDENYKVVREETTATKLSKNAYIWVHNGKILDIKKNADTYKYPVYKSVQIAKKGSSDSKDDDRVLLHLPVYYKNGEGILRGVKVRFVSAVETIETTTGDNGQFRHGEAGYDISLLEDVTYVIVVDDEKYGIKAFPLVAKDKSEYRTAEERPGERYFYNHSNCEKVNEIRLVDKKDAHANDTAVTSISENTTVSGFCFNDLIIMEKKLSKNRVTGLSGKDYDVLEINAINPHRWEISKLAAGNFRITEKVGAGKKVKNVYYLDDAGKLHSVGFKQSDNKVSFTMKTLSMYPIVIEYYTYAVKKVAVSGGSKTIAAGKKLKLTAKITPSNATNKAVQWSSSNKKYATVDSKGNVTTKKAGAGKTVKITATAKDGSGKKGTYQIKIAKNVVTKITLKASKTVKAGKKLTVKATVKTNGKYANKKLAWSTSNKKYATVNSKGKVTAKKAGKGKTVKITAKATDGSGKKRTISIKIR